MARKRLDLTFPPRQATKPITYHLVKDYDLVPNILRAQIQPGQEGRMLLEVTGTQGGPRARASRSSRRRARRSARRRATSASTRSAACVCGLCTAVCKPDALTLDDERAARVRQEQVRVLRGVRDRVPAAGDHADVLEARVGAPAYLRRARR